MKKSFFKRLTAILLAVGLASSMAACELVTPDTSLTREQTAATVKIDGTDDMPAEYAEKYTVIKNSDLVSLYQQSGYVYVVNFGYTVKDTIDLLLNSLIRQKINLQKAILYFNAYVDPVTGAAFAVDAAKDKWDVERYLTADEIVDADYQMKVSVNDFIDDYVGETASESSAYTGTPRTAPTDAAVAAKTLTTAEKQAYKIDTGVASDGTANNSARRIAYQKLLKSMEANGYIGSDFNWATGSIADTEYYKDSVYEIEQQTLLSKYARYLAYDYYASVDYDALSDYYAAVYEAQKASVNGYADYVSLLGKASASAPIVFNPYNGQTFGYVYNLLLGVDSVQSEEITALNEEYESSAIDTATYRARKNEILMTTTAKDLRDSWITAGYDFDLENKTFLNDYAVAEEPLPYKGTVTWVNGEGYTAERKTDADGKTYFKYYKETDSQGAPVYDDAYAPKYRAKSTLYTISSFLDMMNDYLYETAPAMTGAGNIAVEGKGEIPYLNAVMSSDEVNGWADKVNELLFAFSTDPGSLNTYKGYSVDPGYEVGYTETYVVEFAAAARKLLADGGKSSYIVMGTDYGWHIMFYSELLSFASSDGYATLDDYLAALGVDDGEAMYANILAALRDDETDAYKTAYLYLLQQAYASSEASSAATKVQTSDYNKYRNDTAFVTVFDANIANIL